ncbi:MAG TPA: hypothetical protein VGM56_05620 [Byssovorax sp.]|jgi:hypothetical protein
MHILLRLSAVALGLIAAGASAAAGCSAGADTQSTATGDATTETGGLGGSSGAHTTSTNGGPVTSSTGFNVGGGAVTVGSGGAGGASCAEFTAEAQQAPAAMLIVLDKSSSMKVKPPGAALSKFDSAKTAILQAIDNDAFDNTSLGLLTFPDGLVGAPTCLRFIPQVSCGFAMQPQIALADSATDKSTAPSGVRHDMKTYLSATAPTNNSDDGSPDYDALKAGYAALTAYANVQKRIAVLVSDGGFSCTSLSNPMRPGYSDGECPDWEYPDSVNTLISGAYSDPTSPINTFIVGVPGSDTNGGNTGVYASPPYSMKLALSTYAVSGSPLTVDPTCDSTLTFQIPPAGVDPAHPCHIDLSGGTAFSTTTLADAISKIRGQALGCTYMLPTPPPGQTIDPSLVNVLVTISGTTSTIPRRASMSDTCDASPCWDYDANGQVILIGAACTEVQTASSASIDIEVGCMTIIH